MTDPDGESSWTSLFSSKAFTGASLFCFGLLLFESFVFPSQYDQTIFAKHFANGSYLRLLFVLLLSVGSILISLAFVWAALVSTARLRIVYFLIFAVTIIAEYGCYLAFGRFSELTDVALALFAGDLRFTLRAGLMYFNYLALIPIGALGILLFTVRQPVKSDILLFVVLIFSFVGFFSLTTFFTKNRFYTVSVSSAFRSMVGFPTTWYIGTVNGESERLIYTAPRHPVDFYTEKRPVNNIVLIVDESVRADHLSLNGYGVPTTPILDDLKKRGFIKNWGIAVSGTTCSVTSNALMLTGVDQLPDTNYEVYRRPTIFRFARVMNYKTHYFDGQVSQMWNGKSLDIPDYGDWTKADEIERSVANVYEIDREIARRIRQITSTSTGNFILVNKFGVHKPYTASYPNDNNSAYIDSWFIPYDVNIDQETLIRQYDEAITYNTRGFFSGLLDGKPDDNTVYVYTSDHGQTLRENGSVVSHCSNTKPEAMVPLLMIGDPKLLNDLDEDFKASHSNIFATLLDLMDFPEDERKYRYAISLLKAKKADSAPRFYYTGNLNKPEMGAKLPFD